MWMENTTYLIMMVIACEAIVNLIFNGTVLQPLREGIIRWTPSLTVREEHPLQCRLCVSVWAGLLCAVALLYLHLLMVKVLVLALVIHRLSNHFHLVFSLLRDWQFEIRVNRGRRE